MLSPNDMATMAALLDEAAGHLRAFMETQLAEQRQVRHFLPDELEGGALMLRDAAGMAPSQVQSRKPAAWIQPDHLQKAMRAPFLCRVEPTQRLPDFVPIYTDDVQPTASRCGYCGQDTIPGSECRTAASADKCAMYQEFAATRGVSAAQSASPKDVT